MLAIPRHSKYLYYHYSFNKIVHCSLRCEHVRDNQGKSVVCRIYSQLHMTTTRASMSHHSSIVSLACRLDRQRLGLFARCEHVVVPVHEASEVGTGLALDVLPAPLHQQPARRQHYHDQ